MTIAKLTASTAALMLCSTALMAQEAGDQAFRNVYIDVDGAAVLIPAELALEACGLDEMGIQSAAMSRLEGSGMDQAAMMAQINAADPMGAMGAGGMTGGVTAAGGALGDASGTVTMDTANAGALGGTGTTGDAGTVGIDGTASADAADATGMGDTTMTADANATTDAGNTTTDMGNATTDMGNTTTAEAVGAGAAAGTGTTDTATADASGVAGQGTTAMGEVQNVESTAAMTDTTVTNAQGTADPSTSEPGQDLRVLAVCQIDVVRASELGIPNITNETVTD